MKYTVIQYYSEENSYLCSRKSGQSGAFENKLIKQTTMYLEKAKKQEIFEKYGKSTKDTGSAESQIALFSYRISHMTEHLKKNHKDYTTARALTQLVGKRRALLNYLYDRDINRYRAIIKALGLRR